VCLSVCVSLLFQCINSVGTFPRQRAITLGVIFYGVRVVLKESRQPVFPDLLVDLRQDIEVYIYRINGKVSVHGSRAMGEWSSQL
jgi:hypothetical protein